jgi:hypothetical protein
MRGAPEMVAKIRDFKRRFPEKVGGSMMRKTEQITTECRRVTPVKYGTLVGTIHAEGPEYDGNKIRTQIVAGGPAATYGPVVHEDMQAHHNVGGPKYIERPLFAEAPTMLDDIARDLK